MDTFCMCPGGLVVPSSSEEGGIITNGMSEDARDRQNANAALHAAHYGYVLETGMMTLSGTGEELLSSKSIQEAYLGRGKKAKHA